MTSTQTTLFDVTAPDWFQLTGMDNNISVQAIDSALELSIGGTHWFAYYYRQWRPELNKTVVAVGISPTLEEDVFSPVLDAVINPVDTHLNYTVLGEEISETEWKPLVCKFDNENNDPELPWEQFLSLLGLNPYEAILFESALFQKLSELFTELMLTPDSEPTVSMPSWARGDNR